MKEYSKYRCLLALTVYELTLKEIAELKRPRHAGTPTWCVNPEHGNVLESDYFHQFTTPESKDAGVLDGDDRKYLMFELMHASPILEGEISQAGFEFVFDGVDWRPLFENMPKQTYEDMIKRIPVCTYVVCDVTYESGGDGEYDVYFDVIGFLDGNMALREVKIAEIKQK
jgi:hypothetical protein